MTGHQNINDVNVRRIFWIAVGFVVVGAAIHLGVWWMFAYWRNTDAQRDVRQTLIEQPSPIPPQPRLQVNPTSDFQEYRHQQLDILNGYGWTSREDGRVHIPIEEAMERIVEGEARK